MNEQEQAIEESIDLLAKEWNLNPLFNYQRELLRQILYNKVNVDKILANEDNVLGDETRKSLGRIYGTKPDRIVVDDFRHGHCYMDIKRILKAEF